MEKGINGFLPVSDIRSLFGIKECELATYSPLTLAFLGDAVYSELVRSMLVLRGNRSIKKLHTASVVYVRAAYQAAAYERILPLLTEEEADILRRGRNAPSGTNIPKSSDREEYSKVTALEALFGYLKLTYFIIKPY